MPKLSDGDVRRFWSRVPERPSDEARCWRWNGAPNPGGYGTFRVEVDGVQRVLFAHRVAFALSSPGGELAGRLVLHGAACIRLCVRPSHLRSGTHADNMADKSRDGRWRGERCSLSKIDEAAVHGIRRRFLEGASCAEIALTSGLSASAVAAILKGSSWTHVPFEGGVEQRLRIGARVDSLRQSRAPPRRRSAADYERRFWARFERNCFRTTEGCLLWGGPVDEAGYGRTTHRDHGMIPAHRLVLERKLGRRLAPGAHAAHSCPVRGAESRACVNPDHLRESAPDENLRDNRRIKDVSEVVRRYEAAGETLHEIARSLGVSHMTVRRALARAGVTLRRPGARSKIT